MFAIPSCARLWLLLLDPHPLITCGSDNDQSMLFFGAPTITDAGGSERPEVSTCVLVSARQLLIVLSVQAKPFAERALSSGSATYNVWNRNSRGQLRLPGNVILDLRRNPPPVSQAVHL